MTQHLRKYVTRQLIIGLAFLGPFIASSQGAESIRVKLASGRTFEGFVDTRTDTERLWLRFEGEATLLYRPISWDRIEAVEHQGRDLSVEQLKRDSAQLKSKGNLNVPEEAQQTEPRRDAIETDAEAAQQMLAAPEPVRSLDIDASIANWDNDYEVDGIRVYLYPLDGFGGVVPTRGTVQVKLVGVRPASLPARYSFPRGEPFPTLGTWTKQLSEATFGPNGAVIDLPFTSHYPSKELDLGAYGTVVARLVIPGRGVFEARADVVRIRPYQPIVVQ